jgi:hypothetical protein
MQGWLQNVIVQSIDQLVEFGAHQSGVWQT